MVRPAKERNLHLPKLPFKVWKRRQRGMGILCEYWIDSDLPQTCNPDQHVNKLKHTPYLYNQFTYLQAVNPNDRIMITCSEFEVGLKILRCMDDTLSISTAPLPKVWVDWAGKWYLKVVSCLLDRLFWNKYNSLSWFWLKSDLISTATVGVTDQDSL